MESHEPGPGRRYGSFAAGRGYCFAHCVQGGWRDAAENSRRMVGNAHGRGGADPGLYSQLRDRMDNRKSGYARGGRHRCAKILAVVPHVEIFLSNCNRWKSNRTAHATFAALLEN